MPHASSTRCLSAHNPGYAHTYAGSSPLVQRLGRRNGGFTAYQHDGLNRLTALSNRRFTDKVIDEFHYAYTSPESPNEGQAMKINLNKVIGPVLAGVGLSFLPSTHAASCVSPPAGLVSTWTGDGTANDITGNNHGVSLNGAAFAPGKVGLAFQFDGVNDYVQVPDNPSWAFGVNDFTIELWANFAASGGSRALVASDAGSGGNNKWIFWLESGLLRFRIDGTPGSVNIGTGLFSPTTNRWYHLAVTRSTTNYTFYIDGTAVSTNGDSRPVPDASAPLTIGQAEGQFYFNGLIDEVALYNRALDSDQIAAINAVGSAGKCKPPLPAASVPYFADFESVAGQEWSLPLFDASTPWPFTRFCGRFGNDWQTLTLSNLVAGESYTLGFDFYAVDSWEGASGSGAGPDFFGVSLDGRQIFRETFSNSSPTNQSYLGRSDEGPANFGFNASYADSIYRNIALPFVASNSTIQISFYGQSLESLSDESWGLDNVSVRPSSSLLQTIVRSTTLPAQSSVSSVVIDRFSIACSRDLLTSSANTATNYALTEAGANGVLGDTDDVRFVIVSAHTAGKTVIFMLNTIPLQPGRYRFETRPALLDTNNSAVASFSREFTIVNPVVGQIENTGNDTIATAAPLPMTETPADTGFFTAFGLGSFYTASDVDYWRFDGEAGDRVTIRVESPAAGSSLYLRLQNAVGSDLISTSADSAGNAQVQNFTLPSPGTYYMRLDTGNPGQYQLRVDQSRGSQMESENNDSQANATALIFASSGYEARVFGSLPGEDWAGDYFRWGTLDVGNVVFATTTMPNGSSLTTNAVTLSIELAGSTNPFATDSTGTLTYTIVTKGVYYFRIQTTNRNLRAQYLLTINGTDVAPPLLTSASLPSEGSTNSGMWDRFTVSFSEDMLAGTVTNVANYELRAAGLDGVFGTGDDQLYGLLCEGYTSGLTAPYRITDGPLQAGVYRLTARTNLLDRAGNGLAGEFVRNFTMAGVSGFVLESRNNDTAATATSLSVSPLSTPDGSFAVLGSTNVGSSPYFVVAGLFNGDTNLDLAVANLGDGTVSVLLGNGDGTFQLRTNQATTNGPMALAVGQLNGDTNLDLVVANNYANVVTVLLGNGDGTFQSPVYYASGSNPRSVVLADFNKDGRLDIAVANESDDNVSVLLGNGDGTFGSRVNFAVGDGPQSVAAGRLNGDTNLDLVVANANSTNLSVLLGYGDGTFAPAVSVAVGNYPRSVAVSDLNGDGKLDLAAVKGDNTVSVVLGNGDGTFGTTTNYPAGTSDANQLVLADFNGDGRADVAVADSYYWSRVAVLLNRGDGSLEAAVYYQIGVANGYTRALAVGDYNGDGRADLVTANSSGNNVTVLLGNNTLEFGHF